MAHIDVTNIVSVLVVVSVFVIASVFVTCTVSLLTLTLVSVSVIVTDFVSGLVMGDAAGSALLFLV